MPETLTKNKIHIFPQSYSPKCRPRVEAAGKLNLHITHAHAAAEFFLQYFYQAERVMQVGSEQDTTRTQAVFASFACIPASTVCFSCSTKKLRMV